MAEMSFLPAYAQVLDDVVRAAFADGGVDVECRPGLDARIVALQVRHYGASVGTPVRCVARQDRVEVMPESPRLDRAG